VLRSDRLHRVSLTPTQTLPTATTMEGITTVAADKPMTVQTS
jgi:hypothetical protein